MPDRHRRTEYTIKGGVIYQKCDACGEKSMVDMQHKITTFILNSHKKATAGSKKDRKREKDKDKVRTALDCVRV